MRYSYDKMADAVYIYFNRKKYAYGEDLDRERRIDYSKDGSPIGVELLCVSQGVDLKDLPNRDKIGEILNTLHLKVLA